MARSEQEIVVGVGEMLRDVCGTAVGEVSAEQSFVDDLDVDSLSMYEIVMLAQDRFGVEIPDEDLKGLLTVGDLAGYIHRAGVAA